ncbi:DUF2285 domain-containing protein [Govanella unica]|uniref:DUF2285 domain-containing protein n=1 Tax=Govanella unica TaxID=2975056 RepID=A0A9X3TXU0_9PROT|nr:DUF2285 domain-containing protein [Govania unica]MDA5193690.1 DUF2285 domain-containing protein [Govania unica]
MRTETRVVQIHCIGEDLSLDPFALELVLDQFPHLEDRLRLMARLAEIYHGRTQNHSLRAPGWTAQKLWHWDALMALDGWRAGLSQRQIAAAIHGAARVEREWRAPDQTMKNRVARAIKRGRVMADGGYRKLLA